MANPNVVEMVREKYGAVASGSLSNDSAGVQAVAEAFGYSAEELASVETWLPVDAWGPDRDTWKQQIMERHGEAQFEPMITGWVRAARVIHAGGGNISLEQAAQIVCPVLLLNGDGEIGNTPRDVRRLAARISNCSLEFVGSSGHSIQKEQPELLLKRIRSFLSDLPVP